MTILGPKSKLGLILAAAGACVLAAVFAVMVLLPDPAARTAPECADVVVAGARLKPLAVGDLAKFRLGDRSEQLSDLVLRDPTGAKVTIASLKGKTVLLNFWATWCGPCRLEMPTLDRLQGAMGGDAFKVVTVDIDTDHPERSRDYLKKVGTGRLEFYADPSRDVANALRDRGLMTGVPTSVLLNRKGCRIGVMDGAVHWDSEAAKTLLRTAIAS